jgi:hypothetical protein
LQNFLVICDDIRQNFERKNSSTEFWKTLLALLNFSSPWENIRFLRQY